MASHSAIYSYIRKPMGAAAIQSSAHPTERTERALDRQPCSIGQIPLVKCSCNKIVLKVWTSMAKKLIVLVL